MKLKNRRKKSLEQRCDLLIGCAFLDGQLFLEGFGD
jgi:hypothetical protein